ncbi:MAG: hypothetical protein IT442_01325 [Phycisphaeraceae bacterium]|nr:hypothetical protein [Phycisphaeraceae bacterium]
MSAPTESCLCIEFVSSRGDVREVIWRTRGRPPMRRGPIVLASDITRGDWYAREPSLEQRLADGFHMLNGGMLTR